MHLPIGRYPQLRILRLLRRLDLDDEGLRCPSYPTFNVADICVVSGAILGALYYVLIYEKHDRRKPDGAADSAGSR